MTEKSGCSATIDAGEGEGIYVCQRKHGHKKAHRETWWAGKGSKAFKITVKWKRRKHG